MTQIPIEAHVGIIMHHGKYVKTCRHYNASWKVCEDKLAG
jgi:hypothetical protein